MFFVILLLIDIVFEQSGFINSEIVVSFFSIAKRTCEINLQKIILSVCYVRINWRLRFEELRLIV